jgi:hypothetical protein
MLPLWGSCREATEGVFSRRNSTLTRRSCDGMGRGAKRPGSARKVCSFEYRFDEDERFARPADESLRIADF